MQRLVKRRLLSIAALGTDSYQFAFSAKHWQSYLKRYVHMEFRSKSAILNNLFMKTRKNYGAEVLQTLVAANSCKPEHESSPNNTPRCCVQRKGCALSLTYALDKGK